MSRRRIGVSVFWRNYDRLATLRAVEIADDLGYSSFWVPEAWGYEVFSLLTEMAHRTRHIMLGTTIVNVFSRSPALLAMSAATLDEISEGRFILGLGTSAPRVIEGFHGRRYHRPLTALREAIRVIQTLLRGERLSRADLGPQYGPFALALQPVRRRVPIYCACLQPKAIELVGELADGWMPLFWPYNRLDDGIDGLRRGAERAGRSVDQITVAPFMPVIPCDDEHALQSGLMLLAFYIGAMGDHYATTLSRLGFKDEVERVRGLWAARRFREAAAAIPPAMVEALVIVGDPAYCREQLEVRRGYGVDFPILHLPMDRGPEAVDGYLRMMAPSAEESRSPASDRAATVGP